MVSNDVKTRILVLSDTHSALPKPADSKFQPYRWPLPTADVLIHAGDLTGTGMLEEHEQALQLLKKVDAELKIVIPGNHDMTLHREYCNGTPQAWCPQYDDETMDNIEEMYTGEDARAVGIVYMVEGVKTFSLRNGARFTVYANAWQPEFWNWAFNYPRDQDRFNPPSEKDEFRAPHPVPDNGIDVMITHGPPLHILDKTKPMGDHVGCEHLRRAVERCKPRLHLFGHIHEDWGALAKDWTKEERDSEYRIKCPLQKELVEDMSAYCDATHLKPGIETLFVNASIMSVKYVANQAPWLVDLMLPKLGE